MAKENSKSTINNSETKYYCVTPFKLVLLSLITGGVYNQYWQYKNWQTLLRANNQKGSPFWRAVFAIFWSYSLFKEVLRSAEHDGYDEYYSPGLRAISYWLLSYIYLGFLPLMGVQRAMNFHNAKHIKNYKVDRKFSKKQKILVTLAAIVVGFYVLSAIIMTAAPSTMTQ